MATSRQFAHFKRDVEPPRIREIPEGGFCISTFLILSNRNNPQQVLMGHINKNAAWDHIGALDLGRVERHSKGWMLPSSGLVFGESPQSAAKRILKEQLGLDELSLAGPHVFSEVYDDVHETQTYKSHWDLEFVFLGQLGNVPSSNAWAELRFVDLTKTRKEEIARGHEDVLALVDKWHPD